MIVDNATQGIVSSEKLWYISKATLYPVENLVGDFYIEMLYTGAMSVIVLFFGLQYDVITSAVWCFPGKWLTLKYVCVNFDYGVVWRHKRSDFKMVISVGGQSRALVYISSLLWYPKFFGTFSPEVFVTSWVKFKK